MLLSTSLTFFVAILAPVAVFAAPAEEHKRHPLSRLPYPTAVPPLSGFLPTGTGFLPTGTGFLPTGTGFYPKPTGTFPLHPPSSLPPFPKK